MTDLQVELAQLLFFIPFFIILGLVILGAIKASKKKEEDDLNFSFNEAYNSLDIDYLSMVG